MLCIVVYNSFLWGKDIHRQMYELWNTGKCSIPVSFAIVGNVLQSPLMQQQVGCRPLSSVRSSHFCIQGSSHRSCCVRLSDYSSFDMAGQFVILVSLSFWQRLRGVLLCWLCGVSHLCHLVLVVCSLQPCGSLNFHVDDHNVACSPSACLAIFKANKPGTGSCS